jgi:hypothetical protein
MWRPSGGQHELANLLRIVLVAFGACWSGGRSRENDVPDVELPNSLAKAYLR